MQCADLDATVGGGIMSELKDTFGRHFRYLRLSITDVCNFSCSYCLPNGYQAGDRDFLSREEIRRLVNAFASLGTVKLRVTGGEPMVRRDLVQIVEDGANTAGIERVVMTSNGYRLKQLAPELFRAGLRGINISLDSLNPATFLALTKYRRHDEVLDGIDAALEAGMTVKVNAVLLGGVNDHEIADFIEFVRERPVAVRFIEMMQTGSNHADFERQHRSGEVVREQLVERGWHPLTRDAVAGPAQEYGHQDYSGRVGIIAPYAADFCDGCNRLRVTAMGRLRLCLFGTGSTDLRPFLQHSTQLPELQQVIIGALALKPKEHFLRQGDHGDTPHLAMTGG
jgi:cyclic pyranopterin phosphate synthase